MEDNNNNKNDKLDTAKKAGKQKIKKIIGKKIISMLPGAIPAILIFVAALFILEIFGEVGNVFKEIASSIKDFFTVDFADGSILVDDDKIDTIINGIYEIGVDPAELKLLGDVEEGKDSNSPEYQEALRKYIKKFYEAQAVTETLNFYHIASGNDRTYGAVYVYRLNEGAEDVSDRFELTFKKYEDMLEMQEDDDINARNFFSIDDDGKIVIAGTTETIVNGKSTVDVTLRHINYKSAISQYTTQMQFLVYLTMISQNPEFVSAVTDLIKDSRIELTVMDNVSTFESTEILTYDSNTDDGVTNSDYAINTVPGVTERTETKIINTNPSAQVTYVRTWFCEQSVEYNRVETKSETEPHTVTLPNETRPSGAGSWKTNQSKVISDKTTEVRYEEGFRGDVKIIVGESGDSIRYTNGEIQQPTFVGLLETEFRIPNSTRKEVAGSNIVSGADMLFYLLQQDASLENMENIMRYALNKYTDSDKYGVNLLDKNVFQISNLITAGGGTWSAIWDNSVSRQEFIELVEAYTPPNATGNAGRSYRTCYNKYFVANAGNFYDICTKNGIDPRFIFCIGIHESAYGTSNIANEKGNFFGWGAYDSSPGESAITFYDMSDGIEAVSSGLKAYTTPGTWQYQRIYDNGYDPTTIDGIGTLYASDQNWANAVKSYMTEIFGCTGLGETNGNIVASAISVHQYLRSNGYTYAQAGISVPNTSGRTIDCSSFVTWVLIEAGVPGFTPGMYQWTSSTFARNPKGWQKVSIAEAAAGDIVVYSGHVEIIAENSSGNRFRVYNCGSNSSIRAEGTAELPETSISGYNKSQAIVILRVPM